MSGDVEGEYFDFEDLVDLKYLVRQFLEEISGVPFRAIDCNQETVYNLYDKLTKAVGLENDR